MPTSTQTITCPDCRSGDATQSVEQHVIFGIAVLGVYEVCNTCAYGRVIIRVDRKVAYEHMGK